MSRARQNLISIVVEDIKDRLQGNNVRANARWGLVTPPQGNSKLIWIRAGASRDSVMLAAGLLAAIRHKRLDVRLVLTYEEEFQDIIIEYLSGLKKIGFGFGCANSKLTEAKMLKRLSPFAIIFAGEPAGYGIVTALVQHPVSHVVNFQTGSSKNLFAEITLPDSFNASEGEQSIEAMSLLMQAQVDTQLGALLQGDQERNLLLIVAEARESLGEILLAWKNSELRHSTILCLSPKNYSTSSIRSLTDLIRQQGLNYKLLDQWDRQQAAVTDEIIVIDQWRWFAAAAASAIAIHLVQPDSAQVWQSMASATVVSVDPRSNSPVQLEVPNKTSQEIIAYWQSLLNEPFQCRKMADENRRVFWDTRRQAQKAVDDLLQRIFDW